MGGMPLGPRRRSWGSSSDHIPVQRITKAEVDEIIASGDFECVYKKEGESKYKKYEGCCQNLYMILHDGKTRVKVAGSKTEGYRFDYWTVVMNAPCINATILLHYKRK